MICAFNKWWLSQKNYPRRAKAVTINVLSAVLIDKQQYTIYNTSELLHNKMKEQKTTLDLSSILNRLIKFFPIVNTFSKLDGGFIRPF